MLKFASHQNITKLLAVVLSVSPLAISAADLLPLKLRFVDANGRPVEGVRAKPGSFVYAGDTGLSIAPGELPTLGGGKPASDGDGKVAFVVPNAGLGELIRFRLNATHLGFAEFTEWVGVEAGKTTSVTLSRGVRLAATAVDAKTGEPIQKNLFAIAEQKDLRIPVDWKRNENGLLVSRRLRDADKRIRLVQIQDEKAIRFSEPVDVESGDDEMRYVPDIAMHSAVTLSGRLSPEVPRPISGGMITACVVWPTENESEQHGVCGHWFSTQSIAADGMFELTDLPADSWVQVIASCDGWFNKSADLDAIQLAFPTPSQLGNLADFVLPAVLPFDTGRDGIVVSMQPTTSGTVRFEDTNGGPIPDVLVDTRHPQYFFHASTPSTQMFRHQLSTGKQLASIRLGKPLAPQLPGPAEWRTDAEGTARLTNMPGDSVLVRARGHRFKHGRSWQRVSLNPTTESVVTTVATD